MSAAKRQEYATVEWNGHYYVVVYRGIEYARFKRHDETNATDFCNGFNAGLMRRA